MAVVRKQDGLTLKPSTGWGRWTIGFVAAFVLLAGAFFAAMVSGQRGGATLLDNLWLSIPLLSAASCAILSLITGLVAVIVRRERSVFVFGAMAFVALVAFFGIGEFAFPH